MLAVCSVAGAAAEMAGLSATNRTLTVQVLTRIKAALPAAPPGWIVGDETKIDEAPAAGSDQKPCLQTRYRIRYRRVAGVREEQRKLDEAYGESARRNQEAAKPQIEELIRQQTAVSLALKKATRHRNEAEQKRLNNELDENGRKMSALHEEMDRSISREVEPYLVKNAEAGITVSINEQAAEFAPDGQAFEFSKAAFALRKDGERAGITGWSEGSLLILFGNWQRTGTNRFQGTIRPDEPKGRAQTIRVSITGDRKTADRLLKGMDLKSILSLMHAE
jgi:hypothetical protein